MRTPSPELSKLLKKMDLDPLRADEAEDMAANDPSREEQALKGTDAFLSELGSRFREDMPPPPKFVLPKDLSVQKPLPWRRRQAVSNGTLTMMALAATLMAAILLMPSSGSDSAEGAALLAETRGALSDTRKLKNADDQLVEALIVHARTCQEAGEQSGNAAHYQLALSDLKHALETRPGNDRILEKMLVLYDKLGLDDKVHEIETLLDELDKKSE